MATGIYKAKLSGYLDKASQGEELVITDHGSEVALLCPLLPERRAVKMLLDKGKAQWSGGKPMRTLSFASRRAFPPPYEGGGQEGVKKRATAAVYWQTPSKPPYEGGDLKISETIERSRLVNNLSQKSTNVISHDPGDREYFR